MNDLTQLTTELLSKEDRKLSSTSQSITNFEKLTQPINHNDINIYLDIGCSKGGFTTILQKYFKPNETHGIEIDKELYSKIPNNINKYNIDITTNKLPFESNSVDLITCLGTLEHIKNYDFVLQEINRLLTKRGFAIFTLPNLGSWTNRLSLLGGWQPRNVEISNTYLTNIAPWYTDSEILNHVNSPTYNTFIDLLKKYNYNIIKTSPLYPYQKNNIVKIIDYITKYRISLSRRFGVLAQKI